METISDDIGKQTLKSVLLNYTVDELKDLCVLLSIKNKPTRKSDLVDSYHSHLLKSDLEALWGQLDQLQKYAVSETLHSSDGQYNEKKFLAKYNHLPDFETEGANRYIKNHTILRFFLYDYVPSYHRGTKIIIPTDLKQQLLGFVSPPQNNGIQYTTELPDKVSIELGSGEESYVLTTRDCERDAQIDYPCIINAITNTKISVSAKTLRPSASAVKTLTGLLSGGDYFHIEPKKNKWDPEIGPIKAFAWPMLLQAAKLVKLHEGKLVLTKAGIKSHSKPIHETLRAIWKCWLNSTLLDEFNRIDEIKGQTRKGKKILTATKKRRLTLNTALTQCTVGQWVSIKDFWKFMQVEDYDFDIVNDLWQLYLVDKHYGNLGNAGCYSWTMFQGRYVLCVLFEYLSALGFIDIAYSKPDFVLDDYQDNWGTEEMDFLSRYDGLHYFRLNALGAYGLGISKHYTPTQLDTKTAIQILPSLKINALTPPFSSDEQLCLQLFATAETESSWTLNKKKAVESLESGHQLSLLRDFLSARDNQSLPDKVESFLNDVELKATALASKRAAIVFKCQNEKLANLFATNETTKGLCQKLGRDQLVVMHLDEAKFIKAVRLLGYGVPNK